MSLRRKTNPLFGLGYLCLITPTSPRTHQPTSLDAPQFIDAMLRYLPDEITNTTKYTGSVMDAFNRIRNRGGFWSGDTIRVGALATADPNTLRTTFDSQRMVPLITGEAWQQLSVIFNLVHEVTHVFTNSPNAGVYQHGHMAEAASLAAIERNIDVKKDLNLIFPNPEDYKTGDELDSALSHYYTRVMGYACRKVKL